MIIKLVRHGQSEANAGVVNATEIGDANVKLTPTGATQAREAGTIIGPEFVSKALIYTSPYLRARMTTYNIIDGAMWSDVVTRQVERDDEEYLITAPKHVPARIYEDPRLREAEFGINKQKTQIRAEKDIRDQHGYFYYRYEGGESPADVYDRMSTFIDSMMRQSKRKRISRILIISHGITIRCFVMRFMKLTVEQFNIIDNPKHCDIVNLTMHMPCLPQPQFISGKWGVYGLRFQENAKKP